ncbi:uncharacterized protein LOC132204235 [Neocloeon triangulifer]|uniref:uncharacterized protein LOC132204235 n=1 Tax=Neocloeon triangulifer TaxID=2078957 RepID=UPI00286F0A62|nr:uncharacterized protein LOC132204235 [Neocloeon triangulifer]
MIRLVMALVLVHACAAVIVNPRTGEVGNRDFLKGRTFAPAPVTQAPVNPHAKQYKVKEEPQEPTTYRPPAFYVDPRTKQLVNFKWLDKERLVLPSKWSSNANSLDHLTRGHIKQQYQYIYFYY